MPAPSALVIFVAFCALAALVVAVAGFVIESASSALDSDALRALGY